MDRRIIAVLAIGLVVGGLVVYGVQWIVGPPPAPTELEHVVFGVGVPKSSLVNPTDYPYVALEKGFFKEEGLDVEIFHFQGGGIQMQALIGGDLLLSLLDSIDTATMAASQGMGYRVIMVTCPVTNYWVITAKDVKSLQELKGKNWAISSVGAASHFAAFPALASVDLTPDDVNFVTIGGTGARTTAVMAGKVDAALTSLGQLIAAQKAGAEFGYVSSMAPYLPYKPFEVATAMNHIINTRPDIVQKTVNALMKTSRWIVENKEDYINLYLDLGISEALTYDDLSLMYDQNMGASPTYYPWGVNGAMDPKFFEQSIEEGIISGSVREDMTIEDVMDSTFVNKALEELGRYQEKS